MAKKNKEAFLQKQRFRSGYCQRFSLLHPGKKEQWESLASGPQEMKAIVTSSNNVNILNEWKEIILQNTVLTAYHKN